VDNDLRNGPCRQVLQNACAQAGFTPNYVVETHDYRTAIALVATGIGITVVPALGVGELPKELITVARSTTCADLLKVPAADGHCGYPGCST
jgi:DNA-binding transcriptional LysR family regulator